MLTKEKKKSGINEIESELSSFTWRTNDFEKYTACLRVNCHLLWQLKNGSCFVSPDSRTYGHVQNVFIRERLLGVLGPGRGSELNCSHTLLLG